MGEQWSIDRFRAAEVVTMTVGLLGDKAGSCLCDEKPDTGEARLCIDALRAVVEAVGDRLDAEQSRRMKTLVTELRLAFVKASSSGDEQD